MNKPLITLVMAFLALAAMRYGAADSNAPAHFAAAEPAVFIGLVWVDGAEPAKGTRVQALVGDTVCGESTTDIGGHDSGLLLDGFVGRAFYRVEVASNEERAGCGAEGASVAFSIGGKQAQQAGQWKAGEEQLLHLPAGAQPAIFSGGVTIDGGPVDRDTPIRAFIGGVLCGELEVAADTEPPLGEDNKYRYLSVLPSEVESGCGATGTEIRFTVRDMQAKETATWAPGFHSLDLSVTTNRIIGCPSANTWAIAAWWGSPATANDTAIEQALATCGEASIVAAYSLDPDAGTFLRYVAGRPDISTLEDVDLYDGIIVLGSPSAAPPPLPIPAIAPGFLANCPAVGKWAISVPVRPYLAAVEEAFATCENVVIAAAYALDRETQGWSRYIAGRPDLTTLTSLGSMEGVLTLGAEAAAATAPYIP